MGAELMAACAMPRLLDDPTVLDWANQRWLLSHGDALCLDDKPTTSSFAHIGTQHKVAAKFSGPDPWHNARKWHVPCAAKVKHASAEVTEYADVDTNAAPLRCCKPACPTP